MNGTAPTPAEIRAQLTVALIFRPLTPDGIVIVKRQAAYPLDMVTAGLVATATEVETTWRLEQKDHKYWTASLIDGGPLYVHVDTYPELLAWLSDRELFAR